MRIDFTTADNGPLLRALTITDDSKTPPPLQLDLPRHLLVQLVATAAAYLLVMGFAFRAGTGIGLIFAIFGIVLIGYYGLPLVLARASGATGLPHDERRGAWGIDTASGYLPGGAAWAQIMTVPLLMLAWAVLVAVIR